MFWLSPILVVAYFLRNWFPAETRYETHNAELLALFRLRRFGGAFNKIEIVSRALSNPLPITMIIATPSRNLVSSESYPSSLIFSYTQELSPGLAKALSLSMHFGIDYLQATSDRAVDALSRCYVRIAKSRQMQLQMSCLIILWDSPTKDPLGLTLSSFTLTSSSLTRSALRTPSTLSRLQQILVCGTFVLSESYQFWAAFRSELADDPIKPVLVAWGWCCKDYRKKTIRAR